MDNLFYSVRLSLTCYLTLTHDLLFFYFFLHFKKLKLIYATLKLVLIFYITFIFKIRLQFAYKMNHVTQYDSSIFWNNSAFNNWTPDPYLESIDAKLETICADMELALNGYEDDIIRTNFDDDDFVDWFTQITPDPYLEDIDRKLERICALIEKQINGDTITDERPYFDEC